MEYYFHLYDYKRIFILQHEICCEPPVFSCAHGVLTAPDGMMYFSVNLSSSREEASKVWLCVFQPAAGLCSLQQHEADQYNRKNVQVEDKKLDCNFFSFWLLSVTPLFRSENLNQFGPKRVFLIFFWYRVTISAAG